LVLYTIKQKKANVVDYKYFSNKVDLV